MIDPQVLLNQLDWSVSKKDYCAMNVRLAFGIKKSIGDAKDWGKYCDTNIGVGNVAFFAPGNKFISKNPAGLKYGHVGVCIGLAGGLATIYDGPNGYCFKCDKNAVNGWISPKKMVELGSPFILPSETNTPERIQDSTDGNGDHPEANREVIVSADDLNKLTALIQSQIDALGSQVKDAQASVAEAHAVIATLAAPVAPTNAPEAPKASTPAKPKK